MDTTVYIVKCPDYDQVTQRMSDLFSLMGGMGSFAAAGERIVLKVNLLQPARPEQAVSTHPAVVAAVGRLVKQEGAMAVIADSPGSGYKYNEKSLHTLYRVCEMDRAAKEAGIGLNRDTTYRAVSFPQGKLIKRFEVITPVLEADGVLNLCKMKTHLFMSMTGAVKNNFGVIPGLNKPGYHAKLQDKERFAHMLLDLAAYVSPRVSVMDAVLGIEGEGPGAAGIPRRIGLLLGARNPLALDVVAGEIMGLPRERNPVLIAAEKRGLAPTRLEEVTVVGADLATLRIQDYRFPATIFEGTGLGKLTWWQRPLVPIFKQGMSLRPGIIEDKCIACGICRDSCPSEAIAILEKNRKYARIDDRRCIRCYCCHELCPQKAIELREGFLYKLINR